MIDIYRLFLAKLRFRGCPTFFLAFLICGQLNAAAVDVPVSGKVTDEQGSPLPGVNIIVKGTSTGTTSDANGLYNLNVADPNSILVFSFIGYVTQEVSLNGRSTVDISLTSDVTTLSEIVVTGYGVQKRSSVTGAVASVSAKEISALPVNSVESALQGRVPGVIITSNGGPGSTPNVRIRGIGSITGSSQPLYVIDGFPAAGNVNINSFDTKEIESVEVLKDAAASAIYGSRAANGVVLITTKTGSKDNKIHVDVDSYYGVQEAWNQLDLLSTDEYLKYGTDLLTNAGSALPSRFSNMNTPIYAGTTQTYAETDTDWQGAMFRSAPIYQTQVALSSSSEKSKLYVAFSQFKQEGIMVGTDFERYSTRVNMETKISKRITFGETLSISYSNALNEPGGGGRPLIQHLVHSVPYIPIYDPTLEGGYRAPGVADGSDPENPIRIAVQDRNITGRTNILGNAYVEIGIIDGLKYRFTGAVNYSVGRNETFNPTYNDGFRARLTNNLTDARFDSYSPYLSNQLTYDKNFGSHSLNVVAVAERQDINNTGFAATGQQATNELNQLIGSANQSITDGSLSETTILSYLARVNYEFKGKYLFSASIRRDGFSGFAPGNKWGNFPGASVGWRISEENFMKSISSISDLKVRASYGLVGSNGVSPYGYLSFIGANTRYPFAGTNVPGTYFDQLPNSELGWEKTAMTNFGIDLGLFENRLTFTAEYFTRDVDEILLDVRPATSLGYTQATRLNIGGMKNWGYEFVLTYAKATGDFTYNLSGNLGLIQNEVTNLNNSTAVLYNGRNDDYGGGDITRTIAGRPIQEFYGYVTDGIFQSQAELNAANGVDGNAATKYQDNASPGDIRFKDLDGNGVINSLDQTSLGSYLPKASYGINFSANYKSFDFNLFFQGLAGNKVYNGTKVLTQGMLRLFGAETEVLNAWMPDNTNTDIPRAVSGDPNKNTRTSDRFVEDGSYLRLKNISIGYNISQGVLQSLTKGSVKKLRIYASAQNLLTFTKYSGYDPEIGNRGGVNGNSLVNGIDYGQFPAARTIMGGVQLGF